jgi:16S rRNA (guanine527-N7)-methyltransferase
MSLPVTGLEDVSRETLARLERYAATLLKWNPRINLVAPATLDTLWTRHILDSAQIFKLADDGVNHWADLGSGGGFPGLVVAILAA